MIRPRPYSDPYLAGAALGLVLLGAFVITGRGLGASGAFASSVASVVDAVTVKSRIGASGYAIVDGRDAVFYDGVETPSHNNEKQRTGHIHGAFSIPYTSITDDRMLLKSPEELAALFAKAGVKANDTVIGYCHIGQQTTAMLFAARTLGYKVVLYDGSFEDWSKRDLPVDNPAKK